MLKNPKCKEIIRYLIVGVLTTVLSLGVYFILTNTFLNPHKKLELQLANIISWFISVLFAYFANRKYVFESKEKHIFKESLAFFSSRLATLILDMLIMFLGVSILSFNDKLVKLFSQIVIIVLNYVLSKLFVFQKKDKKFLLEMKPYYFYFLPILDFLTLTFAHNNFVLMISLCYKIFIYILLGLTMLKQKKYYFLLFLGSYLSIQILYLFCQNYINLTNVISLLDIFMLPFVLTSLKKKQLKDLTQDIFYNMFFLYVFVWILEYFVFKTNCYSLYPIMGVLLFVMVPSLLNHNNYLMKIISFLIIFAVVLISKSLILVMALMLSIILFFKKKNWQVWLSLCLVTIALGAYGLFYQKNTTLEKVFFDSRIVDTSNNLDVFNHANIEEKLFGIYSISDLELKSTRMDYVDILFTLGYVGTFVYLLLMYIACSKLKYNKNTIIVFSYTLLISLLGGSALTNFSYLVWMSLYINVYPFKKQKRVLIISNMYPSKKYPHYGTFVKNCKEMLEDMSFKVDIAVKYKQDKFVYKFIGYSLMYIKAIFKSIWYSYDYYYVHFTAQTAYSILLGKWTGKTKLICNVHGNDIVPDYEFEEKNVKRSQIILKYADKVVCPSSYFQDVLTKEYHILTKKIVIFPSGGVNLERFKELTKEECQKSLNLDTKYEYYGCITRMEKNKGWDTLLNVLSKLKKDKKLNNIKLLFVGSGMEEPDFLSLMKKNHLEKDVIIKPFVTQEELASYYNALDLFIFPTKRKSESLGLVGLEAMACKTFVIGCDLYGPREYLKNNKNSLTFKTEKELYEAILKYQRMSENEKEKIIKNGYKTVQNYSSLLMEDRLKQIFKN